MERSIIAEVAPSEHLIHGVALNQHLSATALAPVVTTTLLTAVIDAAIWRADLPAKDRRIRRRAAQIEAWWSGNAPPPHQTSSLPHPSR